METVRSPWKVMEGYGSLNNNMEPIEVIRNSKKAFVRQKYLIWDKGTDRQTDRQTHRHTDTLTHGRTDGRTEVSQTL